MSTNDVPDSQIEVIILADSISDTGARLTTFELFYHRYFHAEFMTHRVISKNAASSRAIPSDKLLAVVETEPMLPISVGKNQAGMQASQDLEADLAENFIAQWKALGIQVAAGVKVLHALGAHKQIVNRPLEAWLPIRVVATATDWDNFFELRDSKFAQPEFAYLAKTMRQAMTDSIPKVLYKDEWHLPYVTVEDREYVLRSKENAVIGTNYYWNTLCALSAARCARVSHALGGLSKKDIESEIEKGRELFSVKHMSPFEHVATPWDVTDEIASEVANGRCNEALTDLTKWLSTPNSKCPEWADVRNLRGWRQLRSFIEYDSIKL